MIGRRLSNEWGVLIALAAIVVLFTAVIGPGFVAPLNVELMARQAAIVCIAAFGMTLVIVAGGIDLSVGSVVALATVVVAQAIRAEVSPWLAAASAVVVGAACGAINGALVTWLRVVPFIVTLGTMLVLRGAAKGLADERRVEAPATGLNTLLRSAAGDHGFLVPWGIWMVAVLAVVVAVVLRYTQVGRHWVAIGSNERTARLCGVPIAARKVLVYTVGGAFAALAGVLEFSRLSVGDPTVAVGLELDVIAAVIIGGGSLAGGKGSVVGTLAGAAIMTVIQVGCSQQGLPNWIQQIVTGVIIVVAVSLDEWRRRRL